MPSAGAVTRAAFHASGSITENSRAVKVPLASRGSKSAR